MRGSVTVKPVKHPRYSWRVTYPFVTEDGSTVRRGSFFMDRKSAVGFAETKRVALINHGIQHGDISGDERMALVHYRQWAARQSSPPSLIDAIRQVIAALESERPEETFAEAVAKRLAVLEHDKGSKRHRDDVRVRLAKASETFGDRQLADITMEQIRSWLHRLDVAAGTKANFRRIIGSVFAEAMRRGVVTSNPVSAVRLPPVRRDLPGTISATQFQKILEALPTGIKPGACFQGFAGLRRSELGRVEWKDVDTEGGTISVNAKTGKNVGRRVMPMEDNLRQWLRKYGTGTGPVCPSLDSYDDAMQAARAGAGITAWPHNALRHTAASCLLAKYSDEAKIARWLGTSISMLRQHYDALVSAADATAWFSISPPSS